MNKFLFSALLLVVAGGLGWAFMMNSEIDSRYDLSRLQEIADEANTTLPTMVDEGTRLERVSAVEGVLEKHYKLVGLAKSDLDIANFESKMSQILNQQSCANGQSKKLHNKGVAEWFTYRDKNGELISTVKVDMGRC